MSISVSAPERQESSGDITGYASILRSILPEFEAEKNGSRELKLGSEENGRLLYGRVVSRNLHVSVPDNIVILSVPGKEARFQYAVTDSNGNFSFQIDIDSLERDVVLQVVENPGNALIMISSPFWESYPGFGRNPDTFISGVPPYIEDWSINYQVARVYGTRPSIDSPVPGKSALLPYRFYGIPDFELIMDDYILLPVMQEVFFELVPGVTMRSNRNGYKITVINPRDNRPYDTDATLMVDGVIVTDPLVIAGLNTEDVERIDVVRDEYFVGGYHFFGILNVVTRKGDSGSISLPADAVKLPYRETAPEPEFFSPGYTSTGEESSRIPDYRNTLYWNPDIKISGDGKATVEFHASDYVSGYVINIQGITSDGKPFSAEKRIRVEDK